MPLYRDEAEQLLRGQFTEYFDGLEEQLLALKKLLDDDDWSFVIKTQALIEACVTNVLITHIGDERLKKTVELLPLADEEVGKLAMAKSLGLITSPQRRFIKRMAALRNKLAHRVDHISFTFEEYVLNLDASSLKDWKLSLSWHSIEGDSYEYWLSTAEKQPKLAIMLATFLLAANLLLTATETDSKRKINAASLRTAEELYSILK